MAAETTTLTTANRVEPTYSVWEAAVLLGRSIPGWTRACVMTVSDWRTSGAAQIGRHTDRTSSRRAARRGSRPRRCQRCSTAALSDSRWEEHACEVDADAA